MKKKLLAVLLMAAFVMTACGGKDTESKPSDMGNNVEETQEQVQQETITKSKALAGVYPEGDELAEIPMGTFSDEGQTDYCTVGIPLNYIGGAVSDFSLTENTSFEMFSGGDRVEFAIEEGLLETGNSISYVVISNKASENTEIYFNLMSAEEATYENVKNMSIDYTEMGTDENPALYYVDESEYAFGDMRLVYSVNPDIMLVIDYAGPLYDELGIDTLAENLYNIIEVI